MNDSSEVLPVKRGRGRPKKIQNTVRYITYNGMDIMIDMDNIVYPRYLGYDVGIWNNDSIEYYNESYIL